MKLNPNINIPAFLQVVQTCKGNVCFATQEGDILNLKSALSQFMFTTVIASKLQSFEGLITVEDPEDEIRLRDYFI